MESLKMNREKEKKKSKSGGFESMGLSYNVYNGIKRRGYKFPTPIQRKVIPTILGGRDVLATSRTGSGKTAGFLIPMLEKLKQHVPEAGIRALILSPTRELALQTLKFAKQLARFTDVRTCLLVGGESMEGQFETLSHSPDVIIATPGRLMHHLAEVDDMSLRTVEYVVFDEADQLFEKGFKVQLYDILGHLSQNRQTLLFSATIPNALSDFANAGLRDYERVYLPEERRISPDLTLTFFTLRQEEKISALLYLIRHHFSFGQQNMVFVSTKHHVEFLNLLIREEGIEPSLCYGDMDQDARNINLNRFRARKTMLMIVSDVAARGLDIPLLDNVINFDFPCHPNLFINRVGRVARNGRPGAAFSLVTSEDIPYMLDLHLLLSKPIKPAPTEEQVSRDTEGAMSRLEQSIASGATVYGRFPQTLLDLLSDSIREIIDSSVEMKAMIKPCANAFRLYTRTKAKPSGESIRRVKDLPREGLHPTFKNVLSGNELTALAFSERLKAFRPKQTVLEAEAFRLKNQQTSSTQFADVMKKKRAIHEEVIKKVQQQQARDEMPKEDTPEPALEIRPGKKVSGSKRKSTSFKDDEYFISSIRKKQHLEAGLSLRAHEGFESNRLEAAVLDLVSDDKNGLRKQKSTYHWDKRHKKYVKLNNGDRVTASGKVKTEGGAKVKARKTGIYKKWKDQSHSKVSLRGSNDGTEEVSTGMSGFRGMHGDNRRFRGGKKQHSIPNAHVPSEIKDMEQIRKERQTKADRMSYVKSKSKKGKFGGKNGKRGVKGGKGRNKK
ncbi:RNA helicase [Lithospermum erythrorhizon]|uniref:RNA helicase n=1 Tax=Lithospermum erythrorhizon TaxID=34254 RepID=A0AAV3Q869_LITER